MWSGDCQELCHQNCTPYEYHASAKIQHASHHQSSTNIFYTTNNIKIQKESSKYEINPDDLLGIRLLSVRLIVRTEEVKLNNSNTNRKNEDERVKLND